MEVTTVQHFSKVPFLMIQVFESASFVMTARGYLLLNAFLARSSDTLDLRRKTYHTSEDGKLFYVHSALQISIDY